MRIAISPDEDPGDTGSVADDGTTERSVNLRVASALQAALARCGQDVWFNSNLSFVDRVAQANSDGTSLLVACAHNASTPGTSGTQFVFCPGGQSFGKQEDAAGSVYAQLQTIAGWPVRLSDAVEDIYECCAFGGDTVYIEYLFMSDVDKALWSQPDYASKAAEATARGLAFTYGFGYVPPPTANSYGGGGPMLILVTENGRPDMWHAGQDGKVYHRWADWDKNNESWGALPGGRKAVEVSGWFDGQYRVCALANDGTVWCTIRRYTDSSIISDWSQSAPGSLFVAIP